MAVVAPHAVRFVTKLTGRMAFKHLILTDQAGSTHYCVQAGVYRSVSISWWRTQAGRQADGHMQM